jgi:GTP-binding protein HflX
MQAWLYDHGEVLEREDGEKNVRLKVRLDAANIARFEQIISASASDNS